jgi:serine/threonine protein kinase
MEYAPFGDLRYYISKGQRLNAPFPEEAIWRIFLQLCRYARSNTSPCLSHLLEPVLHVSLTTDVPTSRGLQALHAGHIIHRDIKPANIFLCQNDLLKIGDLGVAKALNK